MTIVRPLVILFSIAAIPFCFVIGVALLFSPHLNYPFRGDPLKPERTPVEIVGGYSLGKPTLSALLLYRPPEPSDEGQGSEYRIAVYEAVVQIGWNEDFILVEQHPLPDLILDSSPDRLDPEWYIIVVSTGEQKIIRFSHDTFLSMREKLGVPASIEMRDARKVYYGGWIPRYWQPD